MSRKKVIAPRHQSDPEQVIPPRMLTIKQAASYLGATVWFVRNLAWNRAVPHMQLGNRIQFDKSDLDAYIDRRKAAVA
jgi:excisionase family DNA binding protein